MEKRECAPGGVQVYEGGAADVMRWVAKAAGGGPAGWDTTIRVRDTAGGVIIDATNGCRIHRVTLDLTPVEQGAYPDEGSYQVKGVRKGIALTAGGSCALNRPESTDPTIGAWWATEGRALDFEQRLHTSMRPDAFLRAVKWSMDWNADSVAGKGRAVGADPRLIHDLRFMGDQWECRVKDRLLWFRREVVDRGRRRVYEAWIAPMRSRDIEDEDLGPSGTAADCAAWAHARYERAENRVKELEADLADARRDAQLLREESDESARYAATQVDDADDGGGDEGGGDE